MTVVSLIGQPVALLQRGSRQFHARLQWLVGINHSFRQRDFFEPCFHLQVQIEITIPRHMVAIVSQPLPCSVLAANALENPPWLADSLSISRRSVQLISARKRSAIEKNSSWRIFAKNVSRDLEHHSHAELILLG